MTVDIDAALSTLSAPQAQVEAPQTSDAVTPETTEQTPENKPAQEPEKDTPEGEAENQEQDVPFPKKAVKAITRRDRTIGKLYAEKQQLLAERETLIKQLEGFKKSSQPKDNFQNDPNYPREDDYETYGEYVRAIGRHEARREIEQENAKRQQEQVGQQVTQWQSERIEAIKEQTDKLIGNIPDFKEVYEENADILDSFPEHIEMVFLRAENAPIAFYTLAKEGKLEELATMHPAQAAMEIAKAEMRGSNLVQQKQKQTATKAPKPIAPATGTGVGAKALENMSRDELKKWLNS